MTRIRPILIAVLLLMALLPRSAFAGVRISSYKLDVTPNADASSAHYEMLLTYVATAETKESGFKYLGTSPVTNVVAHAPDGAALRASAGYENSSGEWRLDFALPAATKPGAPQTAIIAFDQALAPTYQWGGRTIAFPWVATFRIPVDESTFSLHGATAPAPPGFTCSGAGAGRLCTFAQSQPRTFELVVAGGVFAWLVNLTVTGVGVALAVWLIRRRLKARTAALISERGVLPVEEDTAYPEPEAPQAGYRAPPPLKHKKKKKKKKLKAKLAYGDALDLQSAGLLSYCALAGSVGMAAFEQGRWVPVGVFVGVAAVFSALSLMVYVSIEKGRVVFLFLPVVAVGCFVFSSPTGGLVGGLLALALFPFLAGNWRGGGSGSSSYSGSSFSSSSCGGGGGSSCGGGGGGGGCGG